MSYLSPSGVARASPGGRLPHQEGQNEDKNEERLREKTKKTFKLRKMRRVELLPTRDCEAGYAPA